jgi:hypothetical protein
MWTKLLVIFSVGVLENFLYTWYLLEVGRKKVLSSSLLNFIYMLIYLGIVAWAIKGEDTILVLVIYAASCSVGNYLQLTWDGIKCTKKVQAANSKSCVASKIPEPEYPYYTM